MNLMYPCTWFARGKRHEIAIDVQQLESLLESHAGAIATSTSAVRDRAACLLGCRSWDELVALSIPSATNLNESLSSATNRAILDVLIHQGVTA